MAPTLLEQPPEVLTRLVELMRTVARAPGSPQHRQLMRSTVGSEIDEEVLKAAWPSIPQLTKADLLADQLASPPFGRRLLVDRAEVSMIIESSGSSGGPKEIHALGRNDEARCIANIVDALHECGVTSRDVVALTLPIGPSGGAAKLSLALREIGAVVLRVGPLSTAEKVEAMAKFGATMLIATPSYVDRLAFACVELGRSPESLGIQRIFVATQSFSERWVDAAEQSWRARVFEWYGNAAGVFAMTCRLGAVSHGSRGTLHWNPLAQFVELLDPTGEPAQSAQRAELVATPLWNLSSPMLRYQTGDSGFVVDPGECACGSDRPGIRSGTISRVDNMIKARGVNLWPHQIDDAIRTATGILEHWVVISTADDGREIIDTYVRPASGDDIDTGALRARLRQSTGLSIVVTPWTLPDPPEPCRPDPSSGKRPNFVDLRTQ